MASLSIRTTVALPADLLRAADEAVAEGAASSRNDLLAMALRRLLAERQRAAIDAGFAGMADDAEYATESAVLEEGFDRSSWETFRRAESER